MDNESDRQKLEPSVGSRESGKLSLHKKVCASMQCSAQLKITCGGGIMRNTKEDLHEWSGVRSVRAVVRLVKAKSSAHLADWRHSK